MAHHHIHIGFDAKRAAQNKTGLGNYSRFVIKGLAQYAPSMRLHLFVPDAGKTRSLGGVDHFGAVTMHFPKTAFWRHFKSLWRSWGVVAHAKRKHVQLYHGLSGELPYGLKSNDIKSVLIVRMEVPCCGGLEFAAKKALQESGKFLPWRVVTVSTDGSILDE